MLDGINPDGAEAGKAIPAVMQVIVWLRHLPEAVRGLAEAFRNNLVCSIQIQDDLAKPAELVCEIQAMPMPKKVEIQQERRIQEMAQCAKCRLVLMVGRVRVGLSLPIQGLPKPLRRIDMTNLRVGEQLQVSLKIDLDQIIHLQEYSKITVTIGINPRVAPIPIVELGVLLHEVVIQSQLLSEAVGQVVVVDPQVVEIQDVHVNFL